MVLDDRSPRGFDDGSHRCVRPEPPSRTPVVIACASSLEDEMKKMAVSTVVGSCDAGISRRWLDRPEQEPAFWQVEVQVRGAAAEQQHHDLRAARREGHEGDDRRRQRPAAKSLSGGMSPSSTARTCRLLATGIRRILPFGTINDRINEIMNKNDGKVTQVLTNVSLSRWQHDRRDVHARRWQWQDHERDVCDLRADAVSSYHNETRRS